MRVYETSIENCFVLEQHRFEDSRGCFDRKYDSSLFRNAGLNTNWVQSNVSVNPHKGTLRGFHFQKSPHSECKLVTCVHGRILDVLIDLRENSQTYLQTFAVELTAKGNSSVYVAEGVAHAYLTLEPNSVVLYQVSKEYSASFSFGVRYDDPKVKVNWPMQPIHISQSDLKWDLL